MQRHELEHLIRAAARITDEYDFVVVGSQSSYVHVNEAPARLPEMPLDEQRKAAIAALIKRLASPDGF